MGLASKFGGAAKKVVGAREQFKQRVMSALRSAGFSDSELKKVDKVLDESEKKDLILLQSIISTLKLADVKGSSAGRLRKLFSKAYEKVHANADPFDDDDMSEIEKTLAGKMRYEALRRIERDLSVSDERFFKKLCDLLDTHLDYSSSEQEKVLGLKPKKT